jgi:hypothetical protein
MNVTDRGRRAALARLRPLAYTRLHEGSHRRKHRHTTPVGTQMSRLRDFVGRFDPADRRSLDTHHRGVATLIGA